MGKKCKYLHQRGGQRATLGSHKGAAKGQKHNLPRREPASDNQLVAEPAEASASEASSTEQPRRGVAVCWNIARGEHCRYEQ